MALAESDSLILILSDLHRPSYQLVGSYWHDVFECCGCRVVEVQSPETTEERQSLASEYAGAIVFHNVLGDLMVPLDGCINVALPGHEWDRYPQRWVEMISQFDQVWAYSRHVADTLIRSGVRCPVHYQAPPLDLEPISVKEDYSVDRPFRFFSCGEAHFRKGFHLLMLAFQEAFPQGQAHLTIKTSRSCDWVAPRDDISIITEFMPRTELLSLYCQHDGYVSASLAEGLGLPVAEAVRAGLPVATNFWGGHHDLLCEEGFFPIDFDVVTQPFCSNPDYYAKGQCCAFSSPEAIAVALLAMRNSSSSERRDVARQADRHFTSTFTRDRVVEQIANRLRQLFQISG